MTIFRSNCLIITLMLVAACGKQAVDQKTNPATTTIAEILNSDLRNPDLSAALRDRLKALDRQKLSVASELQAAGFRRMKSPPDCEIFAYEGPSKSEFGVDDTVRIKWKDCRSLKAGESEMIVSFGDA